MYANSVWVSRRVFVAWHDDRTLFTYNIAAYMLVGAGSLVLKLYRHKGGKGPQGYYSGKNRKKEKVIASYQGAL